MPSPAPSADSTTSSATLPRARRLGFAVAVYVLAVIMFASNMVVLSLVGDPQNPFAPTPAAYAAALLLNAVWAIVMVGLVLGRLGGLSLAELGWRIAPVGRNLVTGAAGFVVAAGLLLALITANGSPPLVEARAWLVPSLADRGLWLIIGVGAAFIEESVFRGTLQTVLVKRLGRVGGVLLTAGLFSLYHLPRGPIPLLGRFLLGSVFGALRERTGGLAAPAFAHFLVWAVIGTR